MFQHYLRFAQSHEAQVLKRQAVLAADRHSSVYGKRPLFLAPFLSLPLSSVSFPAFFAYCNPPRAMSFVSFPLCLQVCPPFPPKSFPLSFFDHSFRRFRGHGRYLESFPNHCCVFLARIRDLLLCQIDRIVRPTTA